MKFQIKRLISQFFFLIYTNLGAFGLKTGLCYPFFYCHACPTANSACPLRSLEISVYRIYREPENFNLTFLLYPLLILGTVGIVTGRAVCGWACPIGLLQRATGKPARMLKKKYPFMKKIGQHRIERYLRYIKYIILIGLVFLTPIFIGFMFTDICPVGVLVGTIPILSLNPAGFVPSGYFFVAILIFILFLILIFTIERGWCRYFCPVGAILAPFNKISYFHVSTYVMIEHPTTEEKCIHCNACTDSCPMGIDVVNMKRDPECILCGKCIDACPLRLISFKRG